MPTRFASRWLRLLRRLSEAGLDLVFPPRCAGCGSPGPVWCDRCRQALDRWPRRACALCGARDGHRPACAAAAADVPVRTYAVYRGPVARALLLLKYRPQRQVAAVMAGWLADLVREEGWRVEVVLAVPLGARRARSRGYNQVALVAQDLAERLCAVHLPEALIRTRETRSQVGLNPAQRRRNVAGAFVARRDRVAGRTVLVVDDLTTSGATLLACAQALRQASAGRVFGASLARPSNDPFRSMTDRSEGKP
ncbi:MAG: ComF family protein [Anaerolineales bacterium]